MFANKENAFHSLYSNAGVSSQGLSVDLPFNQVDAMISLNVRAVSALTHLFGRDMKERRRGRILNVSSICGSVAGIPTVAVYSATKAFEKTLSISMAKEMERYGVGVTCLSPGAVKETEFRSISGSGEALCWQIPFYPKTPPQVAEAGVRALLRGDTEVIPGLLNRVFLKVIMPVVPPRIHNWVAEVMWNPVQLPFTRQRNQQANILSPPQEAILIQPQQLNTGPRYKNQPPPITLKLDEPEQAEPAEESFVATQSGGDAD
jgi:short-subunit dehydrogenase